MEQNRQVARRAGWLVGLGLLALGVWPAPGADPSPAQGTPANPSAKAAEELFARRTLPRIQIEIPPEGIAVLRGYNWRRGQDSTPRTDARATVREGHAVYTNVAVHLKGSAGSFRPIDSDKPALTLNFDKFAEGQRFHGLRKMHLNNSVQDPSFVSEQVCRELCLQAGIPTPRATHAVVELNGRAPQLYVLVEGWNKQFLKRHFKNADGNLYDSGAARDIDRQLDVNSGEHPEDRSRLDALVSATKETDASKRLAAVGKVLDLDRFLTFAAMEVIMAHWDGYAMNRNNYRVFHDLDSDRLVFLPHGMDQMFGVWRSSPTSTITPMMKGLVAKAVIQSPEGRWRYLQRMSFLITNDFDAKAITNRVRELSTKIQPALAGDFPALIRQESEVNGLCERVATRLRSVQDQLQQTIVPLKFDASGVSKLTVWRYSTEAGSPSFNRNPGDPETLEIKVSGYAYGSWRTDVLLAEGEYQFVGRVRGQGLRFDNNITRGGITLRTSGDRSPRMLTAAPDWTTFTYDFTITGVADTELVCELRASQGRAFFDVDSLRLIQKPTGKNP
jgi:hypothetical protein